MTQSSLADLLSNRGQYDEAERLYRSGLAIAQATSDLQGVAVFLMGLGQLTVARGKREEAVPLFVEARDRFQAIGLDNWAEQAQQLLDQIQNSGLSLGDLIAMIQAARQGDRQRGQAAWDVFQNMSGDEDPVTAALGRGLTRVLVGVPAEEALAGLPDEMWSELIAALR